MDTGWLDAAERVSRLLSIAAIPVVLAVGGWVIQRQLQNRTVSRDYVNLALTILQNPDQSKVPPELREWAVDLLNDNSPTKLNQKALETLKSGAVTLPAFNFVSSGALTPSLRTDLEASLKAFQGYLANLGFSIATRSVSVEIVPGNNANGMIASYDPNTASIVVAGDYASEKVTVLRQLAHHYLSRSESPSSTEFDAIESGLATYLPCSFLNSPTMGDRQNLRNSRKFGEINLESMRLSRMMGVRSGAERFGSCKNCWDVTTRIG